jgi:transcriptional regulator with XRE-family HTH domain
MTQKTNKISRCGIAEVRKRYGLSQSKFAKLIGLPKHVIKNLECQSINLSPDVAFKVFLATGFDDDKLRGGILKRLYVPKTAAAWAAQLRRETQVVADFEAMAKELLDQTFAAITDPAYSTPSHHALLVFELILAVVRFREHTRLTKKGSTTECGQQRECNPEWATEFALGIAGVKEPHYPAVRGFLGLDDSQDIFSAMSRPAKPLF